MSDDLWNAVVDANLKSAFLCCRAVVPHMKAQRHGSIINFSSMSVKGTFGALGTSAVRLPYAGAKSGIIGFTSQLAKDLGPFGIRVNAIMPGFILTPPDARVAQRFHALSADGKRPWYGPCRSADQDTCRVSCRGGSIPGLRGRQLCLRSHHRGKWRTLRDPLAGT